MPRRWGVWRAWGRTVGTAAGAWFVRPESSRTSRSEARRASRAARWRTAPACTVGTVAECVECGAGSEVDTARGACTLCGYGQFSSDGSVCDVCAAGSQPHDPAGGTAPPTDGGADGCDKCVLVGVATISAGGVKCEACALATEPNADRTVCEDCATRGDGHYRGPDSGGSCRSVGQARSRTQIVRRAAAVRPGMRGQKGRARCVRTARLRTRRRRRASGAQTATLARLGCARSVRRGASRMVTRRCARTARLGLRARAASVSSARQARSPLAIKRRASCAASTSAGSDGTCAVCDDGTEPNDDLTACQPCAPTDAGTAGVCDDVCCGERAERRPDRMRCVR